MKICIVPRASESWSCNLFRIRFPQFVKIIKKIPQSRRRTGGAQSRQKDATDDEHIFRSDRLAAARGVSVLGDW